MGGRGEYKRKNGRYIRIAPYVDNKSSKKSTSKGGGANGQKANGGGTFTASGSGGTT